MVVLIKSSKEGRSFKLSNNGQSKPSVPLNEIIEALMGLTFNIEVKITDISVPDVDNTSSEKAAKQDEQAKSEKDKSEQTKLEQVRIEQARIDQAKEERAKEQRAKEERAKEERAREERAREERAKEERVKEEQANDERAKLELAKSGQANNETIKGSKPKSNLIKEKLKIGEVKTSCCIAVDNESKPPVAYISYDDNKLLELMASIDSISGQIESSPHVTSPSEGDIILAKSIDDNKWYRALIERVEVDSVDVYFFDWGLREKVLFARTRHLLYPDIGMAKYPACALKLAFVGNSPGMVDQALTCELPFRMMIKSYDDTSECYQVNILEMVEN